MRYGRSKLNYLVAAELRRLERGREKARALMPAEKEDDTVLAAREDPNTFIEYCFVNERGVPIKQAAHHREWQELFNQRAVALLGAAELGKTQSVAYRLIWELGRNVEKRFIIIGASQGQAKKILGVIKRAIESNERVRRVFPGLRPGAKWTESELLVQRKHLETKDYSVQAYGWDSDLLGARTDGIVADDINNLENTRTVESRRKILDQFDSVLQSRLVDGAFIWAIGNAWHQEDLVHTLSTRPGFAFLRTPALTDDRRAVWPEQMPVKRLAGIRGRMTELAFARMYMCKPISDGDARFHEEWFDWARDAGRGFPWSPPSFVQWPHHAGGGDVLIFTGIDLASGKRGVKRKTDRHSIFTVAYHSRSFSLSVVDIQTGRWKAPELLARMRQLAKRYDPLFVVEDNGTQQLLIDVAANLTPEERTKHPRMRVTGLTTGSNKWDPAHGIEGMALDFEHRRILLPALENGDDVPEIAEWLRDLLYFTPAEHTSDIVIAGWIAWTAARKFQRNPFAVQHDIL